MTYLSSEDKNNTNSINPHELSQSDLNSQYQENNEYRGKKVNKKATVDKSKLNNVIISMFDINNKDDKNEIKEEDIIPEEEINDNNINENNNVIIKSDASILKNETISREDFQSMIEGYSEKDAVEKFLSNIYNYEYLEKEEKITLTKIR